MRSYGTHLRNLVLIILGLFSAYGATAYGLDPFQIFHDQLQTPVLYSTNHRFQVPGLIRKYLTTNTNYDSIILGTSMTMNFKPSQVEETMEWGKVLPLSVSGGSPKELTYVLRKALDTGRVRHVLMGIYHSYAFLPIEQFTSNNFPIHLYQGCPVKYLFSIDTMEAAFEAYISQNTNWKRDLDTYNYWMNDGMAAFRSNNNEHSIQMKKDALHNKRSTDKSTPHRIPTVHFPSFETHLLPLIEGSSSTEFVCFFPPYSLYYYAMLPTAKFAKLMDFYARVVNVADKLPNVTIYGFSTDTAITNNMANYSDDTHFSAAISTLLLENMSQGHHQLTPANWKNYRDILTQLVQDYQIASNPAAAFDPSPFQ